MNFKDKSYKLLVQAEYRDEFISGDINAVYLNISSQSIFEIFRVALMAYYQRQVNVSILRVDLDAKDVYFVHLTNNLLEYLEDKGKEGVLELSEKFDPAFTIKNSEKYECLVEFPTFRLITNAFPSDFCITAYLKNSNIQIESAYINYRMFPEIRKIISDIRGEPNDEACS
jgi:hypothetical protein